MPDYGGGDIYEPPDTFHDSGPHDGAPPDVLDMPINAQPPARRSSFVFRPKTPSNRAIGGAGRGDYGPTIPPPGPGRGVSHPQVSARGSAMRSGRFHGQYAWHYLTPTEQAAYATWKESGEAGVFGVLLGGEDTLPKNWLLLEEGSVPGVAARDVGYIGQGYLAAAARAMQGGGTARVFRLWAEEHDIKVAEEAAVT